MMTDAQNLTETVKQQCSVDSAYACMLLISNLDLALDTDQ